jgi:type IV pilus assembly protein PilB
MEKMQKMLLGEILIKRKKIVKEQLETALGIKRKENIFIGEILVRLGYVDEKDIVVALVIQCGLPYIAVNKYPIDPQIIALIPKEVAVKEKVIALDRIGEVLSVVMTNPLSETKKKQLESITHCRVATFISTKTEVEEAIARHYS